MTNNIQDSDFKFVGYCRKSSDSEDKQIASLPDQVKVMTDFANKNHLKLVEVLQEHRSAFKTGRPVFMQMLKMLEDGKANAVLAWDPSRIARNSQDGGRFIYMMDELLIKEFRTPQKSFLNTGDDKMMLNVEFTMTKKYSDDLSNNVHRGNRRKFWEAREWGGVAKPGYLNYTDPLSKENHIKVDNERFALLQKAGRMIISGELTPMEAFHKLNDEWHYKTRQSRKLGGKPMSQSAFYRFLSDPFYKGVMRRKMAGVISFSDTDITTMFTKEEFDLLLIRVGRHAQQPYVSTKEFAYRGILRCGECHGKLGVDEKWQVICTNCKEKFNKGKDVIACPSCHTRIEDMKNAKILHYLFYYCINHRKRHNCSQGGVEVKKLEDQIDEQLIFYKIPVSFRDWAIKYLNENHDFDHVNQELIRQKLHKEHQNCLTAIDNLLKLKISPDNVDGNLITEVEYENQRKDLLNKRDSLLEQIKAADAHQSQWLELSEKTFDFACNARYWLEHGDKKAKGLILDVLGENLYVKDKILDINAQKPFFLVKKGKEEILEYLRKLEPGKVIELTDKSLSLDYVISAWRRGQESNLHAIAGACFQNKFLTIRSTPP